MEHNVPASPEWEEDDEAMRKLIEQRWRQRIGHECGHTTARSLMTTAPTPF